MHFYCLIATFKEEEDGGKRVGGGGDDDVINVIKRVFFYK